MISAEILRQILTHCRNPEMWAELMSRILPEYNITSRTRLASFIAQVGHESSYLNTLRENLNYSAAGLRATWPRHFPTDEIAREYARQPIRIASRAYANRMGNGDERSQDGWRFKGRGLIQVTGRNNYTRCSQYLFRNDCLLDNPDLLLEPEFALRSACWFWDENGLNALADDVLRTTRRINGGTKGLQHRQMLYDRGMRLL